MTAKQKAAREKFKAVVKEAAKLRKKNPKLTQAQAVKQAWAISYSKAGKGKKVAAIKIIEKGESKSAKPKATYQQVRSKKGTFKGLRKVGATSYYGSGKRVFSSSLRIGEKYEWIEGAKYLEVKYIGLSEKHPDKKSGVKFGDGKYLFQFTDDGSYVKLSSNAVFQSLRTIPKKVGATDKYHKDTKSHNVNIRVVSGYKKPMYSMGNVDTKKLLDQFAKEGKLKKDVVTILKSKVRDYDNDYKSLLKDILYNGLQSGIISELVYYSDTLKWFKKHNAEISKLLREAMFNYGTNNPADLFGRNWDQDDPFVSETTNKNLLAWFSFEETAREIADRLGYEI